VDGLSREGTASGTTMAALVRDSLNGR
jgi:hypothetical protein